ncbi:MAG: DUF1102 domain-containing protein [Halorubrum sp.]
MERRKFIIGAGALATGSAAAIGSGAFTSVQADRDISIEVADDDDAFLALQVNDGPNSAYAEETGGTIEFNFDGDANTEGGSGISDEAFWNFEDVFAIQNQGTQSVGVQLEFLDEDGDQFMPGNPALASVSGPVERAAEGGWYTLNEGDDVDVGFFFNLQKDELGDQLEDLDTIVVHADADEAE